MIKTVVGIILLLIPFLLVAQFKDKRKGFFYIMSLLLVSIFLISFITQVFGIFKYWLVLLVFAVADIIILIKADFKLPFELKDFKKTTLLFALFFSIMLVIIFLHLYSVHYNYTGTISTIEELKEVSNMKYPYPYFSDEWVLASLMQYSIDSGKLPLINPLWHNIPFPNFSFPVHTFSAGFFLLLDLNPIKDFAILSLLSGILICILVYFILRFNNAGIYASLIASLSNSPTAFRI